MFFQYLGGYMKSAILILSVCISSCATMQNEDGSSPLTDFFGGVVSSAAGKEIDNRAKITKMEVVQKLGNAVSIQVFYKDLFKPDGVQFQAKAVKNGSRIPGITSTVETPGTMSGTVDLTLTWSDALVGRTIDSNQIEIELSRDGTPVKTRTFKLTKNWNAMAEPDVDSPKPPTVGVTSPATPATPATTVASPTTTTPVKRPPSILPISTIINEQRQLSTGIIAPLPVNTCYNAVQGKIAWDYSGHKIWSDANVQSLCKGKETSIQPARCFEKVMHGNVSRGNNTKWQWNEAINLCQGSNNADVTTSCFSQTIALRRQVQDAIIACKTK